MKKAVIVDDNPNSYSFQPENVILIRPFTDDLGDDELKKLMTGFVIDCNKFEGLRDAVKDYLGHGNEKVKSEKSIFEISKNLNPQTPIKV